MCWPKSSLLDSRCQLVLTPLVFSQSCSFSGIQQQCAGLGRLEVKAAGSLTTLSWDPFVHVSPYSQTPAWKKGHLPCLEHSFLSTPFILLWVAMILAFFTPFSVASPAFSLAAALASLLSLRAAICLSISALISAQRQSAFN